MLVGKVPTDVLLVRMATDVFNELQVCNSYIYDSEILHMYIYLLYLRLNKIKNMFLVFLPGHFFAK